MSISIGTNVLEWVIDGQWSAEKGEGVAWRDRRRGAKQLALERAPLRLDLCLDCRIGN